MQHTEQVGQDGRYRLGAMTKTPWGDSESLRERKLAPGARVEREEVVKSQRERLFGAIVAVSAERGYEATTVADLLALSGVSRAAFYEHFANKEACFGAALSEILERTWEAVSARYDGRGSALAAFIEQIVTQPAAARLCFVESFAAGAEAVALFDEALVSFEGLYQQALDAPTDGVSMPPKLVQAIVGGLRKVIYTRLRQGEEEELRGLADQLGDWSLSYEPPPLPLAPRARAAPLDSAEEDGRSHSGDAAERIISAATETFAERGYSAAKIGEIVERASVSLSTFYEHFDGKEDAFVAALDAGQGQLFAQTLPAYREAKDWPAAVRSSFEAMTDHLAANPAFAQFALVEIFCGTSRALERRDRTIEGLLAFLAPGYERAPGVPAIAAEAIGGAVYELIYRQVRDGGGESLPAIAPLMTYVALAPFLGAEEACEVANEERMRPAGSPMVKG